MIDILPVGACRLGLSFYRHTWSLGFAPPRWRWSVRRNRVPRKLGNDVSRIWALLSDREGDNAQVLAVAEALGRPFETRRFRNRNGAIVANLLAGPRFPAL